MFYVKNLEFRVYLLVMTSAQVKMLDDYSKEANGPNYTMRRQHEQHKESVQQMEQLRKVHDEPYISVGFRSVCFLFGSTFQMELD